MNGVDDPDRVGEEGGRDDGARGARRVHGRGRSVAIWALALSNAALAGLVLLGLRYLAGAESYAVKDSMEFGADLDAVLAGIWVLRISAYVLMGGFLLSALGVLSLTRSGWRIQALWAVLLCLTLAGLLYGVPVLILIRSERIRTRFFPATEFAVMRDPRLLD